MSHFPSLGLRGGIRFGACSGQRQASSSRLERGFRHVVHLQGKYTPYICTYFSISMLSH